MSPPKHAEFCDSWLVDGKFQSRLARDEKSDRSAKCKLYYSYGTSYID